MILKPSLMLFACMIMNIQCQNYVSNENDSVYFINPNSESGYQNFNNQQLFGRPQNSPNTQFYGRPATNSQQQITQQQPQQPTSEELIEANKNQSFRPSIPSQNNNFQNQNPQEDHRRPQETSVGETQRPQRPNNQIGPTNQDSYNNHQQNVNNQRPNIYKVPTGLSQNIPDAASFNQGPKPSQNFRPQNYRPQNVNANEPISDNFRPISDFALQLFKASNNPQTLNMVMCPLSPQVLLSYLALGSEGETQQQIQNSIQYSNPHQLNALLRSMMREESNRELQFATAFFIANNFQLANQFKSNDAIEVLSADFRNPQQFSNTYNAWARRNTKGTIPQVNFNPDPSTKMIMSSAAYFKGGWIYKFNPATRGEFSTQNGPKAVPMMTLRKKLPYGIVGNMAEWISIPYNSSDSMIVILPKHDVSLDNFIQQFNKNDMDHILDSFGSDSYANVNLTMPKFKIDSISSLVKPLQKMGIKRAFSENSEINQLTSNREPLQISSATQQASMEVNEEGSIASSLTSFSVVALSYSPPVPDVEFLVNRPFIAIICDRNRNFPYFIAKVSSP